MAATIKSEEFGGEEAKAKSKSERAKAKANLHVLRVQGQISFSGKTAVTRSGRRSKRESRQSRLRAGTVLHLLAARWVMNQLACDVNLSSHPRSLKKNVGVPTHRPRGWKYGPEPVLS